jgi:hypothetical protein
MVPMKVTEIRYRVAQFNVDNFDRSIHRICTLRNFSIKYWEDSKTWYQLS